jgi:hypothetical protein
VLPVPVPEKRIPRIYGQTGQRTAEWPACGMQYLGAVRGIRVSRVGAGTMSSAYPAALPRGASCAASVTASALHGTPRPRAGRSTRRLNLESHASRSASRTNRTCVTRSATADERTMETSEGSATSAADDRNATDGLSGRGTPHPWGDGAVVRAAAAWVSGPRLGAPMIDRGARAGGGASASALVRARAAAILSRSSIDLLRDCHRRLVI